VRREPAVAAEQAGEVRVALRVDARDAAKAPRHRPLEPEQRRVDVALGFGRIGVSEKEAPIILVNLV
jgi:hypothetical protein